MLYIICWQVDSDEIKTKKKCVLNSYNSCGYTRVRVGGSLLVDSDEVFGDFLVILCSNDVICR